MRRSGSTHRYAPYSGGPIVRDRRSSSFRLDVDIEVVESDRKTGKLTISVTPNKERYEWVQNEKGRFLFDRLDNVYIEPHIVSEAIQYMLTHPAQDQQQLIENAQDYWLSRVPIVREAIRQKSVAYTFTDKSETFLEELSSHQLNFVILSVDVVGSTKLANDLRQEDYSLLMQTLLSEISEIVPKFRCYVLKYTGDGLIAYFPEPSFITMNDLALDCALTIRGTIMHAVNKVFDEFGLPRVQIRIGIDSGLAPIVAVGSASSKQHKDIIGIVVSLAAKIQALAMPNEILYGETVERNLHTNWRKHSGLVNLPESWNYHGSDGQIYRVYRCGLE